MLEMRTMGPRCRAGVCRPGVAKACIRRASGVRATHLVQQDANVVPPVPEVVWVALLGQRAVRLLDLVYPCIVVHLHTDGMYNSMLRLCGPLGSPDAPHWACSCNCECKAQVRRFLDSGACCGHLC